MNGYQKRAHRRREDRLQGKEVDYYLALACADEQHADKKSKKIEENRRHKQQTI